MDKPKASPVSLCETLLRFINEVKNYARASRSAEIWAKFNSVVDGDIIDALNEASNAWVKIQLDGAWHRLS